MKPITKEWAQAFYAQHMRYLAAGQIDQLVTEQFAPDAVLISYVDYKDTPPPHTAKGTAALQAFFKEYNAQLQYINVTYQTDLLVIDNILYFQPTFDTSKGRMLATDCLHFNDDGQVQSLVGGCYKAAEAVSQ